MEWRSWLFILIFLLCLSLLLFGASPVISNAHFCREHANLTVKDLSIGKAYTVYGPLRAVTDRIQYPSILTLFLYLIVAVLRNKKIRSTTVNYGNVSVVGIDLKRPRLN